MRPCDGHTYTSTVGSVYSSVVDVSRLIISVVGAPSGAIRVVVQPTNNALHSTTKAAPNVFNDFICFLPAAFAACELPRWLLLGHVALEMASCGLS